MRVFKGKIVVVDSNGHTVTLNWEGTLAQLTTYIEGFSSLVSVSGLSIHE